MKTIDVISFFTPYHENIRGISALIYYLIKFRPSTIKLKLYTFNANNLSTDEINVVSKELGIQIVCVDLPKWYVFLVKFKLDGKINLIFPYSVYMHIHINKHYKDIISSDKSDALWIYPYILFGEISKFKSRPIIISGCDSNYLYFERLSKNISGKWLKKIANNLRKRQAKNIEKWISTHNCKFHLVGNNDLKSYKKITSRDNAFYAKHPHYKVLEKTIKFDCNKMKILLAGSNDIYMETGAKEIIFELVKNAEILSKLIDITFLGKGWNEYVEILNNEGYQVNLLSWVDNYLEEIIKYDIQLIPISLGTGTKGKVLDAMSNGLLCIGTYYAFENIAEDGKGVVLYNDSKQITDIIRDIYNNMPLYEKIAEEGRARVLLEHNPYSCSELFFNNF